MNKHLLLTIADLKDAYEEVSKMEGHLDNAAMPIRNELFEKRDRKGLIELARLLPEQSMARRYVMELIYRLDDIEVKGEK